MPLIVLEGLDGCGKTTQVEALREWLPDAVITREPGGTPLGKAVRELLLHGDADPCDRAELLLYAADRMQHVERVIRPALEEGRTVVCDRFAGSTAAYQGYGRGLSLHLIGQLQEIATDGLKADLTIWLDVPVEVSIARRQGRGPDRIEAAGAEFLEKARRGFWMQAQHFQGWHRIDATQPIEAVTACVRELVRYNMGTAGRDRQQPPQLTP